MSDMEFNFNFILFCIEYVKNGKSRFSHRAFTINKFPKLITQNNMMI